MLTLETMRYLDVDSARTEISDTTQNILLMTCATEGCQAYVGVIIGENNICEIHVNITMGEWK